MINKKYHFYSKLYTKASEYIFHASKETVFVRIAKAVVDKIDEFPHVNIEELALAADTTPPSVTRFCRLLGYAGFSELKNDTGSYEVSGEMGEPLSEEETLREIYAHLPFDDCQKMADLLSQKKRILVLTNEFTFTISNMLKSGISNEQRRVYTVDRSSDSLINYFLDKVDCIVILTLTGDWITKDSIFTRVIDDISFCLISGHMPECCKNRSLTYISMKSYPHFMSSNYHSHKYMESIVFNVINRVK